MTNRRAIYVGTRLIMASCVLALSVAGCSSSASKVTSSRDESKPRLAAASSAPCAEQPQAPPLFSGGDLTTPSQEPSSAIADAAFVDVRSDADGNQAAVTARSFAGKRLWTYRAASAGGLAFAADSESGIERDGDYTFEIMAHRVVAGTRLIDIATGKVVATFEGKILAVSDDCHVATVSDGTLRVIGPDGTELWSRNYSADNGASFVGTSQQFLLLREDDGNVITAFRTEDGQQAWSQSVANENTPDGRRDIHAVWGTGAKFFDMNDGSIRYSSESVTKGQVLSAELGIVCARTDVAESGADADCNIVDLVDGRVGAHLSVVTQAIAVNGGIVVEDGSRAVSFYSTKDIASASWTKPEPAGLALGTFPGSVTSDKLKVVLGFDTSGDDPPGSPDFEIWAVDTTTGKLEWRKHLREGSDSAAVSTWIDESANAVIVNPQQYVTSKTVAYAFDAKTGRQLWRSKGASIGLVSPVTILRDRHHIVAVDSVTGKVLWHAGV